MMRSESSVNSILARVATLWISPAMLSFALIACSDAETPAVAATKHTRQHAPPKPTAAQVEPLSQNCRAAVERAEKEGLLRPGSIDRNGAVILTDSRWATRLDAGLQEDLALCVSHFIAGGQNRWVKRVQFRNQASGVVYATLEGQDFRIGE